jgi:hypothetical protein
MQCKVFRQEQSCWRLICDSWAQLGQPNGVTRPICYSLQRFGQQVYLSVQAERRTCRGLPNHQQSIIASPCSTVQNCLSNMFTQIHHAPEFEPLASGKYAKTYSPDSETERTRAEPKASLSEIRLSEGNTFLSDVLGG